MTENLDNAIVKNRLAVYKNPWLTLMHFHVTFIPAIFGIMGALLATHLNILALIIGLIGLIIGKYGFYCLDEATGRQWSSNLSRKSLLNVGYGFLIIGLACGVAASMLSSWNFLIIVALIVIFGWLYNVRTAFDGAFHNKWNFASAWAVLPFIGGYFLMSNTVTLAIIFAGITIGVFSTNIQYYSEIIKNAGVNTARSITEARVGQLMILVTSIFAIITVFLFRIGV